MYKAKGALFILVSVKRFWLHLTKVSPCTDGGCDGGNLLWADDNSNFDFTASGANVVSATAAGSDCVRGTT